MFQLPLEKGCEPLLMNVLIKLRYKLTSFLININQIAHFFRKLDSFQLFFDCEGANPVKKIVLEKCYQYIDDS